ncbi:MAG: pseudouridylate synthase [Bacteroidaceae bacterium]|nr:pseudouridylate synthase [Bacteroidaceae bacterium]
MKNSDFRDVDVLDLLPQQPPFVMVDRLVFLDGKVTVTETDVRPDNLFMEDYGLNPCGLIENIAQTCAARMGYINKYVYREGVKLGFIGAIKDLCVFRTVRAGERLTTRFEVLQEVMQLTLGRAEVKVGDEMVVTAEIKIALSDIDAK